LTILVKVGVKIGFIYMILQDELRIDLKFDVRIATWKTNDLHGLECITEGFLFARL